MKSRKENKFEWRMSEMPNGITTSNGNWYSISRDKIEEYIPGLLKKYSLEKIIRQADDWVSSANSLAMIIYLGLVLAQLDATLAMGISILFFLFWHFKGSAFVTPSFSSLLKVLNLDGFMYLASGAILIYLAWQGQLLAMWLGIILFFLFKVGLLQLLIKIINAKNETDKPEIQDRILNMLLVRYGIKEGIMPTTVQKMQDDLIEVSNYHKIKKKKK